MLNVSTYVNVSVGIDRRASRLGVLESEIKGSRLKRLKSSRHKMPASHTLSSTKAYY